jgi:hypothetical protein
VTATPELHPAQNRGLRELIATTRHLGEHWDALAPRIGGSAAKVLDDGVAAAASLINGVRPAITLLGYQAAIAEDRRDEELTRLLRAHERPLLSVERAARRAVLTMGGDPDGAIERLDPSVAGRVAHGAPSAAGAVGEWVDRKRGERGEPG